MADEKENKNAKWYIVKSTSGKENNIAGLLKQRVNATGMDDKILDVVVPTQEKIVIKKGKKQTIKDRFFPGYILVYMEATDDTIHLVRNTDGIQGFIGYSQLTKRPKPLNPDEVTGILEFTKVTQPTYQSSLSVGDTVKVEKGHNFHEFIGTVTEINESKGKITVLLSIFDRETPVQLNFDEVSKI